MATEAPWAAVISDVRLPDGLATDWFVELPSPARALPWFFLTGYGSVNDAVATIRAGAREYLTKPFDIERLVTMVQAAVTTERPADDARARRVGGDAPRRGDWCARSLDSACRCC